MLFWVLGAGWLSAPLLHLAQRGFEEKSTPQQVHFASRTTFILLGGGTRYDIDNHLIPKRDPFTRIVVTAELYRDCRRAGGACRVIVSGGNPQHHEQAEADNYGPFLLARGVSASDLVLENESLNTYQNARNVASIVQPERDETLVLITSAYHMRRSLLAFNAFGLDTQVFVSNVRQSTPTFFPRLRGFVDAETALHELIGIARFRVYRRMGLY
ncbi:YdcF family protein [Caballeronia sp. LjRoot29]|uniref:YdcF family protein n=1 Tax=Caballeronia sp. LjRoot29 TaxID=3342315 RepID=UPI003F4F4DAE